MRWGKKKEAKMWGGVSNKNKNGDEPKDNMYGIWNFEINNLHYTQKQGWIKSIWVAKEITKPCRNFTEEIKNLLLV